MHLKLFFHHISILPFSQKHKKVIDILEHIHMLLQVRAIDNGSPPRHTDHSLTINILDVNDNAPVIESQRGYNVSISEVGSHLCNT